LDPSTLGLRVRKKKKKAARALYAAAFMNSKSGEVRGSHPHKAVPCDLHSFLARIRVQLPRLLLAEAERLHPRPAAPDVHDAPEPEPLACCVAQQGREHVENAVHVEQVERQPKK
jgi:hypothetical protein